MSDEEVDDENTAFGKSNTIPRSPIDVKPKTETKKEYYILTAENNQQIPTTSAEKNLENPYANVTERKKVTSTKKAEKKKSERSRTNRYNRYN